MSALPCPNCGSDLTLLEQYRRHFCYACGQYAPDGYGDQGERRCPSCGGILSYIAPYDRFFCYRCNLYALSEAVPSTTQPVSPVPATGARSAPPVASIASKPAKQPAPLAQVEPTFAGPESVPAAQEEPEETDERPPLTREVLNEAKKAQLLDLSREYGLDPTGTKEQLREHLLSYLESEETKSRPIEFAAPTRHVEEVPQEEPTPEASEPAPEEERATESGPLLLVDEPASTVDAWPLPTAESVRDTAESPHAGEPTAEDAAVSSPPTQAVRVEHPCPTCGRELDFIAQYGRWYCHACKAYAPIRTMKHACPTCGTTLRWIDRYARWWCDAEQRYAPPDLPGPAGEAPVAWTQAAPAARAVPAAATATAVHRHRSPSTGIGLAAFGLLMWATYQVFVILPTLVPLSLGVTIPPDAAFLLQFLGLLFLGVGLLAGLASVKGRR